jgi:hypothetical protein
MQRIRSCTVSCLKPPRTDTRFLVSSTLFGVAQ